MSSGAERSFEVPSSEGVALSARLAAPPSPIAALLLCHGLSTDRDEHGAFPALRDHALRAGLAVVRFDFRAHGASGGSNAALRLAGLRADADAIVGLLDEQLGAELPVVPLGLSFGGGAAIHVAASGRPCAGLALWYAVVDYEWNYGPGSPVPFTRRMRAGKGDSDPDWAEMPLLGSDYHFPAALIAEAATDATPAALASLRLPVLAYHGTRDPFVDVEPLRRIAAERPNIKLRIAWGAGHGFLLWRPIVVRHTARWAASAARAFAARAPA